MKAIASDYSCCKYSIQGTLSCGSSCNPKENVLPNGYPHKDERAAFSHQQPATATRETYVNASAAAASPAAASPAVVAPAAHSNAANGQTAPAAAAYGQVPLGYEPYSFTSYGDA